MNHFIPCASVEEHHAILINDQAEMVYAGPLAGITETHFNQAKTSLVHPRTLEWIKQQADAVVRSKRIRL